MNDQRYEIWDMIEKPAVTKPFIRLSPSILDIVWYVVASFTYIVIVVSLICCLVKSFPTCKGINLHVSRLANRELHSHSYTLVRSSVDS